MVQRLFKVIIISVITFALAFSNVLPTLASTDMTPPTVKSITIDKDTVQPGESIHIEVEAEDLESGISDNKLDRVVQVKKKYGDTSDYIYLQYNATTNKYEGTYTVKTNAINGKWEISYIYIEDKLGNIFYSFPSEGNVLYKTFNVTNGYDDITPPTVKSITIDKETVQPGEEIHIEVVAEDLESGISDNKLDRVIQVKKKYGDTSDYIYLQFNATTNKYEGTYTVKTNAINGEWEISYIYIEDKLGNIFYSFPSEGNVLYKTFNVTNGYDDITPPTVKSITIDKEAVLPGDTIHIEVVAEDLESGISDNKLDRVVQVKKKYGDTSDYIYLQYNATTNKYEGTYTTRINTIYGKWEISYIYIEDKVGNTFYSFPSEGNPLYKTFRLTDDIVPPEAPTVNALGDNSTTISGTAEAGSTIIIKVGTKVIGSTKANTEGKYSVAISKQKAGTKISVTATDKAENISEVKVVTVKDVTAPTIPTVNDVTENATTVSGTAEAGSNITVKIGTVVIGKGTADKKGNYAVTIVKRKVGTKISVIATDNAGNKSNAKVVIVKDNTKPTISGATNKTIKMNTTFNPRASVTAKDNVDGDLTASITVKGTVNTKKKGTYKLTYTVTDQAGNVATITRKITVMDTIKPTISGAKNKTINMNTVFDPKAGVTAQDNADGDLTSVINVTGTVNTNEKGIYTLTYTVTDQSGNVATSTRFVTVVDKVKPTISGAANKTVNINATFNPKAGVTAKDNVDGDLTSTINVTGTVNTKKKGIYTLTYTVTDQSGNVATITRFVTVVDKIKPTISGAANKSVNINATFNPKAGVTAKDNVDGNLTNTIKVTGTVNTKKKGIYKLTYTVVDQSGNVATITRNITVVDNIKPTISGATNKTIKLNATFNAKASVTAKDNVDGNLTTGIKVTGTVNTKKKGAYTLTYTVTDQSGNKATVKRIITVK